MAINRQCRRRSGILATLRINYEASKEQPGILMMGALNFVLLSVLITLPLLMLPYLAHSASPLHLAIAKVGAVLSVVLWCCTTGVGATLYREQIHSKRDIDELLGMTEALQSAESYEDTASVLRATSSELLPRFGGALYVFNNSRDRMDLAGSWDMAETLPDFLSPSNCWTLKRGKIQINRPDSSKLCCAHHVGEDATLEVPMIARGAVYGLLMFQSRGDRSPHRTFAHATRSVQAMADAMSLALSNIALREKLRTQSLRDPLTGLYNRRYMEDALERYVSLAERNGAATSVLMIDLDSFKRLNDEHGHAKGDAVLRDVAAQLVGGLRPSDVVCRYGGEELLAILPDCSLDDAAMKAESLRLRVEGLSEVHGVPVTASFGVACIPETSSSIADLVATADAALYLAKSEGKNRVIRAKPRAGSSEAAPRLTVAG